MILKVCVIFMVLLAIIYMLAFLIAAIKTKLQKEKVPLIYKRIFYVVLSIFLLLVCVGEKMGVW